MLASELLKQVYTKFYNQKQVLNEAPLLTQDPSVSSFNNQKADIELAGLVSYLMGVTDIQKESFEKIIDIIQTHYGHQPEWKELLVEYFEYTTEKEKEELQAQERTLIEEIKAFAQELLEEGN